VPAGVSVWVGPPPDYRSRDDVETGFSGGEERVKWLSRRLRGRRREPPAPVTASKSAFTQLLRARQRRLASSQECAAAGDGEAAKAAFLDADAISGELEVLSAR
jgi:hypothetical protein